MSLLSITPQARGPTEIEAQKESLSPSKLMPFIFLSSTTTQNVVLLRVKLTICRHAQLQIPDRKYVLNFSLCLSLHPVWAAGPLLPRKG